mgnify:CR=1 FL=1
MSLILFEDYPLDKLSLIGTMLNPIDLSRTLILLKLDISALLGYTGAIFKQFFGTNFGLVVSISMLAVWVIMPVLRKIFNRVFTTFGLNYGWYFGFFQKSLKKVLS